MPARLRAVLALALSLALVWALHTRLGSTPPFGKLFSPYRGLWRNAEATSDFATQALHLPGLRAAVTVRYDAQRVPHVFAQNNHDLYLAQGYLVARDRLWQMDFVAHVAGGRLAEIVGPVRLETDRFFRRMGLGFGAERSLAAAMADPVSREVLQAYAAGVNAYIAQLTPATRPFEYKLLDYEPEPWTPFKSVLILKYMAFDLTGRSDDMRMSNIRQHYGAAVVEDLFPNYPRREDPVIPPGTPLDFTPLPKIAEPQAPPGLAYAAQKQPLEEVLGQHTRAPSGGSTLGGTPGGAAPDPNLGSNNFAVSGAKSATGFPLLANDPHLQLNLPSIWYQIQLSAPGSNVYGVSIPGTPLVIIGFNEKTAWGVTNTYADVLDWYGLTLRGPTARREYRFGPGWRPLTRRIEHIKVRGAADCVDTVLYTHYGPVVYDRPEKPFLAQTPTGHALRWAAHDAANEFRTFYQLNRATSYADYTAALTHYGCPAQNFVFAAANQDVALWANGRFPRKYPQQGKFLLDGADPAQQWQGWVPAAQNPHVRNPVRGFVSSANQSSVRPQDYPYYLNWNYGDTERGQRINQRLTQMSAATVDSLRLLQNDDFGLNAQLMLPRLLALAGPAAHAPALAALRRWNYRYAAEATGPAVFELWYNNLVKRLWDDDFGPQATGREMRYPSRDRTNTLLLSEPASPWIDDRRTLAVRETLPDLARASLAFALDSLRRRFGPDPARWHWADQKGTDVLHLLQLPGFGHLDVRCGGGAGIVNATTERTGPSWRMVVALGPQGPRGFGVYPGGASGNPGSFFYDNQLETWRVGQLHELVFLRSAGDPAAQGMTGLDLR